jgi:ABC-type multidrug transport system ATPase subunit/ABC-type multidrug transport system permease subunit
VLFREVQGPSNAPFYPQGDMAPSCLEWTDLSLTLKKKGKVLIDTMSGTARSGRVLALMGPSGAGKTTLLNALGNRAPYGIVKGEITFGQRPFVTSDLYFVPQFDEVNDNLTVYEQIELVGLLKCSDDKDMHTRLDVVLRSLGLFEKSSMSCKGLTGGELKKVSVGMGMISNPKVLFLDEPTTGLDSTAAYYIVKHLVDVAVSFNIAIILTMHQPAKMVFDLLQDLYLLEGGRLVFNGPLSCSERYFYSLGHICRAGINPADFYLDLVSKPPDTAEGLSWQKLYSTSKFAENYASEQHALVLSGTAAPAASQSSSTLKSLYHLLVFFFKYYCRDKGFYFHRIVSVVCISFFSGTLFLQLSPETSNLPKYTGALLFNMWTIMFSVVSATGLIARDRRQVVEQVKNAVLGPGTYCFAQFVASLPFNFVAALVFQSVFHWLTNINPDSMAFLYSLFISWGHLLLMEAFMLCIVEALKNAMLCVTCAIVVLGYLFLFAGFFVKVSDMPTWISWISYIAPTKYSFDGYLYEIFHSQEFFITGISPKVYLSGDYLLKELFTQSDVEPWSRFGALVAWIFLLRLTHYGIFLFQVLPYIEKRSTNPVPETQGSTIKRNSSIRQC